MPRNDALRHHDERVGGEAHHDGWHAVEHVGGEADGIGQLGAAAKLGQIDAAADADGNADEAGERKQHDRSRRWRWPCRRLSSPSGLGILVKKVELSELAPL